MTSERYRAHVARLAGDFAYFLAALWDDRGLDKVAPLGDVEFDIARFAADPAHRRRVVLAFRGVGKTHIVVASLSLYRGLRDPNRKIIIPSKSVDAAKKTVRLCREWLDRVWFLAHLAPRGDQRDAATYLDFGPSKEDRQPSITAIGIDGQLENNRAHSIFPDDVETKANTTTIDAREDLDRRCKEFSNILYPDRPFDQGGPIDPTEIVAVGTPKHEETLYGKFQKRGWTIRAWPIACPTPSEKVLGLAPLIARRATSGQLRPGEPTCPHRFGPTEITGRRAEGYHEFAMESMLIADLAESNRYPLRLSDLMVMPIDRDRGPIAVAYGTHDHNGSTALPDLHHDGFNGGRLHRPAMIDPRWSPFRRTIAYIDPAGVGEDRTGLSVVSQLGGFFFAKVCTGLLGGVGHAELSSIARTLRRSGATEAFYESNIDAFDTFGPALELELRRLVIPPGGTDDLGIVHEHGWACSLDKRRSSGQKELRILASLEPFFSTHRVVFDPACFAPGPDDDEHHLLYYQISRLTKAKHCLREDGAIDSLASAFAELRADLAVNPQHALQDEIDRINKATRDALHLRAGIPVQEPRWFHHGDQPPRTPEPERFSP